jgi:hypothetical protein
MIDEFYASIKLISGEEIFSKVCPVEEENKTILMLENPVIFENVFIRHLEMNALKIEPWLKSADDPIVLINMDKVITITEVTDEYTIESYDRFVKNKDRDSNQTNPTQKMGYLSSISNARISLEKIYKSS